MWVHRLPVHIVPEEVANLTQSSVKLVYFCRDDATPAG